MFLITIPPLSFPLDLTPFLLLFPTCIFLRIKMYLH